MTQTWGQESECQKMLQEAFCVGRAREINSLVQSLPSTGGETVEACEGGGLAEVTPPVSGLARKGG